MTSSILLLQAEVARGGSRFKAVGGCGRGSGGCGGMCFKIIWRNEYMLI